MATAREIHRHMKSVGNIGKITKAMKMVAAARLRRAQERAAASRPYAIKIKEVLSSVVSDPLRAGTFVNVARSEARITLGCSVMWLPYAVHRSPFHSNQSCN